jgi:hypothetical protein
MQKVLIFSMECFAVIDDKIRQGILSIAAKKTTCSTLNNRNYSKSLPILSRAFPRTLSVQGERTSGNHRDEIKGIQLQWQKNRQSIQNVRLSLTSIKTSSG